LLYILTFIAIIILIFINGFTDAPNAITTVVSTNVLPFKKAARISAIFNLLCVVGISAAISPIYNTNDGFLTDYICMVALSGLLWFFLSTKKTLERWEGIVLVTIYVGYITYTVI